MELTTNLKKKTGYFLLFLLSLTTAKGQTTQKVPAYLQNYETAYRKNPKEAALQWYEDARFGMFIHWGAYSYYEKGEWVMFYDKIPMDDYQKQAMNFKGEQFDANQIVDLAKKAGMKYITFVVKHHDGFAMYDTKANKFSSKQAVANRDFLKELATACEKESLGLFIYYSLGIDWNYPFYLTTDYYKEARPHYAVQPEQISFKSKEDFLVYWNFVKVQIYELATQYGSIAGFWFDPIGGAYTNPDLFDVQSIYDMIHRLQPQALISYKTGFNGNEDFIACEHEIKSLAPLMRQVQGNKTADQAEKAWQSNKYKPAEMTTTLQSHLWGYAKDAKHKTADQVWKYLAYAAENNANLLLNIGPYYNGSVVAEDENVLVEIGKRIKKNGLPGLNKKTYKTLRDQEQPAITKRDLETQK